MLKDVFEVVLMQTMFWRCSRLQLLQMVATPGAWKPGLVKNGAISPLQFFTKLIWRSLGLWDKVVAIQFGCHYKEVSVPPTWPLRCSQARVSLGWNIQVDVFLGQLVIALDLKLFIHWSCWEGWYHFAIANGNWPQFHVEWVPIKPLQGLVSLQANATSVGYALWEET